MSKLSLIVELESSHSQHPWVGWCELGLGMLSTPQMSQSSAGDIWGILG